MNVSAPGIEQAINDYLLERTRRFAPGFTPSIGLTDGFAVIDGRTEDGYWSLMGKTQLLMRANMALAEQVGYVCVKDMANLPIRFWTGTQTVEIVCDDTDDSFDRRMLLVGEQPVFDVPSAKVAFRPMVERCGKDEGRVIRLAMQFEVEPADFMDAWRYGGDDAACAALWRMLDARAVSDTAYLTASDMYDGLITGSYSKQDAADLAQAIAKLAK